MNEPTTFHSLYDVPCSDLGLVAEQVHTTNDPETLRRYVVGLWLDVFLLQLSIGVIRGSYAALVSAAQVAVSASAPDLTALRLQLEVAIEDPDLPIGYLPTDRAGDGFGAGNGRRQ